MGKLVGAVAVLAVPAFALFVAWRITSSIEGWFMASGAGALIGWTFAACLALSFLALPFGAFGLAARMYVVKLNRDEYLESTPHALAAAARPRALTAQQQRRAELEDAAAAAALMIRGDAAD